MLPILRSSRVRRTILVYAAILVLGGIAGVLGGIGVVAASAMMR